MSERHPDAVASLADEWVPWLEAEAGMTLRPWQLLVARRALEVDAEGRLCWRTVVVSTPRQSGKSVLLRGLSLARASMPQSVGGEPQEILFLSNNLGAARRIHAAAWNWAEERGVTIRRAFGNERMIWPDGGHWSLTAANSVWGNSVHAATVDECWDVSREVVDAGLWPTMVERPNPQVLLFSTANANATDLLPAYRGKAVRGERGVMLAEWGAEVGDDPDDPTVWTRAAAHMSEQRREFMESLRGSPGFREQWLNVWPSDRAGAREWPEGWSGCPRMSGLAAGGVGALESSVDRSRFGVAAAVVDGRQVVVESARFHDGDDALRWLEARSPRRVLVGASLLEFLNDSRLPMEKCGSRQTWAATPVLADQVARGLLSHDHCEEVLEQTRVARVAVTEQGMLLSGKASRGPVETLKATAWAVWGALLPDNDPAPAIY